MTHRACRDTPEPAAAQARSGYQIHSVFVADDHTHSRRSIESIPRRRETLTCPGLTSEEYLEGGQKKSHWFSEKEEIGRMYKKYFLYT